MMKNIYLSTIYTGVLLLGLAFNIKVNAQETACDSVNSELTSKFRFLGEWDSNGTPYYMDPASDEVSQALINFVNETLPESVNFAESNLDYFGIKVQLNTELKEASEVYLTLVHEGAGWENTLGYYTYEINNPPTTVYDIDSLVVLFPNVSQTSVIKPGDKVLLGEFPANTGIGYFLIAKGWVGDTICLKSHIIFTDSYLNTFTSEEYRQQTILLSNEQENKFLLGFEDIIRPGGDNDFNDAVFYITATPGAIDTTNIAKVPTARLSGDTTVCDQNAPVTIDVELTGQAPWSIIYNTGFEEVEITGIEQELYSFETIVKDTIKLVSVKDKNKIGIADGEAVVKISHPKAILDNDQLICDGGTENSGFIVKLEGEAPFSLTYSVNNEEKTIDGINEDQIEIIGSVGEVVELLYMSDQYCDGEIIGGEATVQSFSSPILFIDGNGSICGDAQATTFNLNLDGEGPWILNYTLDGEEIELPIETNEYQLEVTELGGITFNSIENENCSVALSSFFNIENNALPTAVIEDYESICGEDAANVNISLTGLGPWNVHYQINGEDITAIANENLLALSIDQSGTFELLAVDDANCENTAEGSAILEINDNPSATISGDATICQDEVATVKIDLMGTAPFTIVYTDGETEATIFEEDNTFEFSTSEFKTYTLLSVEDANCSGNIDGSATISDGSEDIQVEIVADDNACFGEDILLSLVGETDNLAINWTTEGNGVFDRTDQINVTYTPGENESGAIVFYAEVSNGCYVKTITDEVVIIEDIDASFDVSPANDLLTESQITFTPSNSNYDAYDWNFGDGNSSTATIASTEYIEGGIYTVELVVSISGCEGSGSEELEVLSKDELYVPNAFNPNAQNQENQVVKVYGNNIDESGFSFKIVNRWGKTMYLTNSFSEANTVGWDGVNNKNDEELELNVFSYILKGRFLEGESFERVGTITQVK